MTNRVCYFSSACSICLVHLPIHVLPSRPLWHCSSGTCSKYVRINPGHRNTLMAQVRKVSIRSLQPIDLMWYAGMHDCKPQDLKHKHQYSTARVIRMHLQIAMHMTSCPQCINCSMSTCYCFCLCTFMDTRHNSTLKSGGKQGPFSDGSRGRAL